LELLFPVTIKASASENTADGHGMSTTPVPKTEKLKLATFSKKETSAVSAVFPSSVLKMTPYDTPFSESETKMSLPFHSCGCEFGVRALICTNLFTSHSLRSKRRVWSVACGGDDVTRNGGGLGGAVVGSDAGGAVAGAAVGSNGGDAVVSPSVRDVRTTAGADMRVRGVEPRTESKCETSAGRRT
jgi:hypothetical protein